MLKNSLDACRDRNDLSHSVSIIVPAFNEEMLIELAAGSISDLLTKESIRHEIIFVDDGSTDQTWSRIRKISESNPSVKGIRFSRNFGKESAIMAGLSAAGGDCSCVIDCDLQHPIEKIVEMYHLWRGGYDIIEAVKTDRGEESIFHRACANGFYSFMSRATGIDMHHASDFKLLDKKAVLVLINMKERNCFFRALSSWIGFKTTKVEYEVRERAGGNSKWSTWKLFKYALNNMTSFSSKPLQLVTIMGMISFFVSLVFGINAFVQKIQGIALGGFTTVIMLLLFMSSIVMFSLGIIGYYISKIYDEIQERPKYIIAERC